MSLISRMRRQDAIYWAAPVPTGYGKWSYTAPVAIKVRWEDVAEEFMDPANQRLVSKSLVYVGQVMQPNEWLKLGVLVPEDEEGETDTDPTKEPDAFRIRQFAQVPNIRNTETLYMAYL